MRHLMLALMILLLPLRGWVGDAMATDMASGQMTGLQVAQKNVAQFATEIVATNADGTGATAQFHSKNASHTALGDLEPVANMPAGHGCADLQAALPDNHHAGDSSSSIDCGVCPACQSCHTVALSLNAAKTIATFSPAALPQVAFLPFASADLALSQKPPIS